MLSIRTRKAFADSKNSVNLTAKFVDHVPAKRTEFSRMCLLMMVIGATSFKILETDGVLVNCLRAHTSGKTQKLDVGLYRSLKNALTRKIKATVQLYGTVKFFQFFSISYDLPRV